MDISEFSRLHTTSQYRRHPWEVARGAVLLSILNADIPLPQPNLIDIGSGDAYIINLVYRNEVAQNYYAIDINYTPEIIGQLEINNNGSPIRYLNALPDISSGVLPAGTNLYLCMDVLEHLENERIVLDQIIKDPVEKGSGYYFITVPAFQDVFSHHDVLLGHYRRYTVKLMKDLCISRGLTVIDSGYFFFTLLLARWIEKKLLRKKEYSIDNWEGSAFKSWLITFILRTDFAIGRGLKKIGIQLPGLSCYCVCRS